jgi:phage N-6-adenine-methyltransferase
MPMNKLAPLMKSDKQDWNTPPEFLELVRKVNGRIAFDPCTSADNPCGAGKFATKEDDGLTLDWREWAGIQGLVYCNPPYSDMNAWAAKISEEGMRGCEAISLTPARTDTKWFRRMVTADAMCFWRGRLKFVGAKQAAPFPSLVCYWGPKADRFREVFSAYGWCPR